VAIGVEHRHSPCGHVLTRRDENRNVVVQPPCDPVIASLDVVEHRRFRREVEGHIVRQHAAGRQLHGAAGALVDQVGVADRDEVGIGEVAVRRVQAVAEQLQQICDVGYAEEQAARGGEFKRHRAGPL